MRLIRMIAAAGAVGLCLSGAAQAQGRGGQGGAAADLPECGVMPDGTERLDCSCDAGFETGAIWGGAPFYTADSDICTAALHAGIVSQQAGGAVTAARAPGQAAYPGSSANGVTSGEWGSYDSSIKLAGYGAAQGGAVFDLGACAPLPADIDEAICACTPGEGGGGSVWGSNPYTADSDICTAAIHAGVIGTDGGKLVLRRAPGQAEYGGSEAHGVTTGSWGSYDESIAIAAVPRGGKTGGARPALADAPACDAVPEDGAPVICGCTEGFARGPIWGSGPYTGDSDICTAALHAGAIGAAGGLIELRRFAGQPAYEGSDRNGITARDWGSYPVSFDVAPYGTAAEAGGSAGAPKGGAEIADGGACTVMPDGVAALRCTCTGDAPRGPVWGSGPYTADSDICTAARHAGVIDAFGGAVRVLRIRGLDSYAGTAAGGVTTDGWADAYDSSIVFDRN